MAPNRSQEAIAAFKPFVAANSFAKIKDKKAVLVLGRMGAGKSTAISIQLGAEWKEVDKDGEFKLELWACPVKIPKVSDGFVSTTLNVGVFEDGAAAGGMTYLDTAGMNENRGPDTKLWTTWSTSTVFSLLSEVSATLVVFDYGATLGGDRGSGVRDLAACLHKLVGSGESSKHFYDSMAFLVTNPFKNGNRVQVSMVTTAAGEILAAEQAALQRRTATFPKIQRGFRDGAAAAAAAMMTGEEIIDWGQVSEAQRDDYYVRTCTVRLMNAIVSAPGRILLSYPKNPKECRAQLTKVTTMLQSVAQESCIKKDRLREIVASRETESLEVCTVLAGLCALYSEDLKKQADALEKLSSEFESMHDDVRAVDSNWQVVRDHLVDAARAKKARLERDVMESMSERDRLKASTVLKPLVVKEVREARGAGANPLSWFSSSYQWARAGYEYNGEWFQDYAFEGKHCSKKELKNERRDSTDKGQLSLVIESASGFDVNCDVKVRRYERDLPTTTSRVADLDGQLTSTQAEIQKLEKEIMTLTAVVSKEGLLDVVMKAKHGLEAELTRIESKLNQAVPGVPEGPNGPMLEGHVLEALVRTLKLLKDVPGVLSADMGAGTAAAIDEVLQRHEKVVTYKQRVQGDAMLSNYMVAHLADYAMANHDDMETQAARRPGFTGLLQDMAESAAVTAESAAHEAGRQLRRQRRGIRRRFNLEPDVAMMALGSTILVFAVSRSPLSALGAFLTTLGVMNQIQKAARRGEHMMQTLPREMTGQAVAPLVGAVNAQGERLENVGHHLADNINVDLTRVNVGNVFG